MLAAVTKRFVLAAFFALVACGLSFYVLLFPALAYFRISGGANPAMATGLQATLRHVLLPVSIAVGAFVFLVTLRRLGARESRSAHVVEITGAPGPRRAVRR